VESAAAECPPIGFAAAVLSDWTKPLSSVWALETFEALSAFGFESLPDDPFELSCDRALAVVAAAAGKAGPAVGGCKFSWNLGVEAPIAADFTAEWAKVSTGDGDRFAIGCKFDCVS
jgi:hypothetical protein